MKTKKGEKMKVKVITKESIFKDAEILTYSSRRKAHRDKKTKGRGKRACTIHEIVIVRGATVLQKISSRCVAYVYDPNNLLLIK